MSTISQPEHGSGNIGLLSLVPQAHRAVQSQALPSAQVLSITCCGLSNNRPKSELQPRVAVQECSKPQPQENSESTPRKQPVSSASAATDGRRKLNRIAEVRKAQGLSERTVCKRLKIELDRLRQIEDPATDLTISELTRIQAALDVPLVDLLEDSDSLSRPIHERAKLVRIMKTAEAIRECNLGVRVTRMADMLREQLVELMPELSEIGSWPQFGSRRSSNAVARVLANPINLSQIQVDD